MYTDQICIEVQVVEQTIMVYMCLLTVSTGKTTCFLAHVCENQQVIYNLLYLKVVSAPKTNCSLRSEELGRAFNILRTDDDFFMWGTM